ASDTRALARLVSDARVSASLAAMPAALPPKRSGSQLASKPAWKRLPAGLSPDLLRWPEQLARSEGPAVARVTSCVARAWRSAAWAVRTLGLAASASATSWRSVSSPKRCHQSASGVASEPVAAADHCVGTASADVALRCVAGEAQPAITRAAAIA